MPDDDVWAEAIFRPEAISIRTASDNNVSIRIDGTGDSMVSFTIRREDWELFKNV